MAGFEIFSLPLKKKEINASRFLTVSLIHSHTLVYSAYGCGCLYYPENWLVEANFIAFYDFSCARNMHSRLQDGSV